MNTISGVFTRECRTSFRCTFKSSCSSQCQYSPRFREEADISQGLALFPLSNIVTCKHDCSQNSYPRTHLFRTSIPVSSSTNTSYVEKVPASRSFISNIARLKHLSVYSRTPQDLNLTASQYTHALHCQTPIGVYPSRLCPRHRQAIFPATMPSHRICRQRWRRLHQSEAS